MQYPESFVRRQNDTASHNRRITERIRKARVVPFWAVAMAFVALLATFVVWIARAPFFTGPAARTEAPTTAIDRIERPGDHARQAIGKALGEDAVDGATGILSLMSQRPARADECQRIYGAQKNATLEEARRIAAVCCQKARIRAALRAIAREN